MVIVDQLTEYSHFCAPANLYGTSVAEAIAQSLKVGIHVLLQVAQDSISLSNSRCGFIQLQAKESQTSTFIIILKYPVQIESLVDTWKPILVVYGRMT